MEGKRERGRLEVLEKPSRRNARKTVGDAIVDTYTHILYT